MNRAAQGSPQRRDTLVHRVVRRLGRFAQRRVRLTLPFDDIMEFALALLALSPSELESLGWRFEDRKRLLDHMLASGRAMQRTSPDALSQASFTLRLPAREAERLRVFAQRELPKTASHAAMLDRVDRALAQALDGAPRAQ